MISPYPEHIVEKSQLRKKYYELFQNYDAILDNNQKQERNEALSKHLGLFLKRRKISRVMIFDPMRTELPMPELFQPFRLQLFFPKLAGDYLYPVSLKSGKKSSLKAMDLIVVPGLFVTPSGYRLGRGKGYYDRLLKTYPRKRSIFVGRSWQLLDSLPLDPWDRRVGFYITEDGIFYCL